jgi:hypothetical protein
MTGASSSGAWGGSHERKRSAVASVSAAVSGNPSALASARLQFSRREGNAPVGNGYCIAFATVDPVEIEARSGLPAEVLMLIGGALYACWAWGPGRNFQVPYVTPVANNYLVDALEAIRPGADLGVLPTRYVIAWLRDLRGLLPAPDGLADAPLPVAIQRVAQLHVDAHLGRVPDAATWSAVCRQAVAATDATTTGVGRAIAEFVEAVAWPMDSLRAELPELVERHFQKLAIAEQEARCTPEMLALQDRAYRAFDAIVREAGSDPARGGDWVEARVAEDPDCGAYHAAEFQDRLATLACAVCDDLGPRAYRVLIDTLKQL